MWLIFTLQYLYQQITYNHLDCYGDNSQISLSRDEFKFVIDLEVVNEACAVFPNSIGANLTVSSALIPDTLQLAAYNFDFLKTTRLEFQIPTHDSLGNPIDLDAYDEEFYALLEIFSYTEITRVELTVFDDVRSDLENCFSSLQIQLDTNNFKLAVTPTKACKQQITLKSGATDTTYISQTVIKLGTFSFDIDVTQFVSKYIAGIPFDFQIFPTNEEMMAILADTNLKANLQLFSQQGQTQVQLNYKIDNFDHIQVAEFTYGQVFVYNDNTHDNTKGFRVSFNYENINDILAGLGSIQYSEIQYRLTGRIKDSVYQSSRFYPAPFNESKIDIDFRCTYGSATEQLLCAKMYHDDFWAIEDPPVYTLDILFLDDNRVLQYMLKTHLTSVYDCWVTTRYRLLKNELVFELAYDNEQCDDILMGDIGKLYSNNESGINLLMTKETGIDRQIMKWSCSEYKQICELALTGVEFIYKFEYEDFIYQISVSVFKKEIGNSVIGVAIGVGVVWCVVCLVMSVIQMFGVVRKMKYAKEKKQKKT
ncbi:Conserved_hypothetical protein [Hexamita inflata]|uniref:Transmembrane protein n=1 Tax=Hexamita inflata TaxID=28002 RepID=A0AA86PY31_9EUKA|nr:Conserved hypothetical protein [Hexamita inflata]